MRDLTFEISGKPFLNDSEEEMRRVARTLFRQWRRLAGRSGRISILLWIADGSEILEYTGNPADTFEWGYWQGIANPMPMPENPSPEAFHNYNFVPFRYREDAAPRTYGWLKRLIQVLREVGTTECGGKPIRIGAAFDNGPEFSVSDFKYRRHREIAQAHSIYPNSFVTCDSVLHADPKPYAGFPEGIPEGTGIGTFLGRQYAALARDFGFDYLWLSNGMGFGTETWGVTGALFDQHAFYPEKIPEASARMLKFWQELLAELPGAVLETRGSNFPAGVEIATDAAPLGFLYGTGVIAPPVNSPMAAIDFNTGLAIASWMSHIAELPGRDYAFRYYIHDPWFLNSPWLDRYGRNPWDLYPVMTVSRMNGAGEVEPPSRLALLTCDDSYGGMPEQVPDEVIPHVIEAFSSTPDRSGPLLWVYPFAEYSRMRDLPRTFNEDMFIAAAIQDGLPLNTVISTGNFRRVAAKHPEKLTGTIPVVPVTALLEEDIAELLFSFAGRGNFILVYGSGAGIPERLAERIGFRRAAPQRGAARAELFLPGDRTSFSDRLFLHEQFSGGPAVEEALSETRIAAQARFAGGTRLLAERLHPVRPFPAACGGGVPAGESHRVPEAPSELCAAGPDVPVGAADPLESGGGRLGAARRSVRSPADAAPALHRAARRCLPLLRLHAGHHRPPGDPHAARGPGPAGAGAPAEVGSRNLAHSQGIPVRDPRFRAPGGGGRDIREDHVSSAAGNDAADRGPQPAQRRSPLSGASGLLRLGGPPGKNASAVRMGGDAVRPLPAGPRYLRAGQLFMEESTERE